jgi:hypothetical protein
LGDESCHISLHYAKGVIVCVQELVVRFAQSREGCEELLKIRV